MSTLGSSRAERNAKPKFSALDINSLYRSSRGESLEPSAQKNAVPRKHGMQILGKVPSTRRPPANLPSLKAETLTPAQDQSGSWPAASSPSANVNNQSSASNSEKPSGDQQQHHHQHQQKQQNYKSKSANNSKTSGGGCGGHPNNSNHSNNNNNSSASWSAVTSAHEPAVPKPLLYQSQQFQHEFPSLDGSNAQVQSKGNRGTFNANQSDAHNNSHINNSQTANSNVADTQYEQNRTEKDGHSEQNASQQQSGGNGNSSTAAPVHQRAVPPQFRALMPTFMHRMSGFDSLPPESESHQQHHQQQQFQHHQQIQSQIGDNRDTRRNYGRDQQCQSYNRNSRGDRNDDRQYRRGPQHRSNRHDQNQYDDYDTGYQSIIKEEELERIDQIVKEDGWVQDDEIDYNQKLVFSDDDSDTPPPISRSKDAKRVNFNDRDKESKASSHRKDEQEMRAAYIRETEREKLDREHNERNEREKLENRIQQNGHRSGAPILDPALAERIKQRTEEEDKRANERRMAAAKKLQELEQKINKKKELSGENENDSNVSSSTASIYAKSDANEPRTNDRYRSDDSGKIRENKDARDYGNRYESKFERDVGDRSRDRGTSNAFFDKPYQSNLPPRFQKQRDQQERHTYNKVEPPHRAGPREQIRRPNQSMQQPHIMKRNVDDIRDSKSGYAKANTNTTAYSTHSKTSSSGLCESEDDDRLSSGRESISRSSIGERTSHLGRSTSDSSQPEIKDKIGSWADEMEMDFKQPQRQISSTSSTSVNDDIQPKQILQRARKVSIDSRSDKEKSEERELSCGNISIKSLDQSQEDVTRDISKQFVTSPSMIEAPKSWADSAPTTPEISRKPIENLSDSSSLTAKTTDTDKKPLESVLENEPSGGTATEKKCDEKSNMPTVKIGRGYSKDERYSSDDSKHGNVLKRPNTRGGRHDPRGGPTRNYGGNTSYRGGNSNWNNNRRGRSNRYNEFSESEGSDDEYHGRGNRGKDDRFKHDSSNRRDTTQSHQKDVFVPRGEPSRRGRGGGRTTGPIVKRIDNYGPPNAKSPFGASDEKSELKSDTTTEETVIKKNESPSADEIASHTTDSPNAKISKSDDKKISSTKPAFAASTSAPQRKDSNGHKVDTQSLVKPDDASKLTQITSQAPQPQRTEKTASFTTDKQQLGGGNQTAVGSKPEKPAIVKKEESSYIHSQRSNVPPTNRGKPQINAQSTNKPVSQSIPAKPVGANSKSTSNVPQSQQPVNVSSAVGSGSVVNRQQQSNKMAPRFVKQPRDRTGSSSLNTWEKGGDITLIGSSNESDFTQRSSSIQSMDKMSQENSNKPDSNNKMSTIIFENTNFKSMPGPIKRQTVPSNQQQMQNTSQQSQRSGVNQYDQVQANNMGGHHGHHPQNQHHLDKKPDDVFKNASSGNFQDILDSQQQMQSQVQRTHQSQTDVISSALQTMSFPKSDAEYDKDLKLAFSFESEILNDTQSSEKTSKGGLCIPPSRSTAIHSVASGQNTISPSIADLSKKITSVKKVWETVPSMPAVIEHGINSNNSGNNDDSHLSSTFVSTQNQQHMHQFTHSQQQLHQTGLASYTNSFGPDPGSLDHFTKSSGQDGDMDNVGYNPSPQHMVGGNNNSHQNAGLKHNDPLSGNVKVKQNQNQPMHQSSLGLSPPPMQQGIQTAPQPYYQPSQFGGMSAIPSPPAVLYNSSPMPSQYGHYERYIASAHYGGGNAAPYNAPYMQSGPNLQPSPAPDMYQNMTSQFRMSGAINQPPYNQQQQLNNQSTVLISSTSNSLMSASVKPSSQIGAIGTKVNAGQTPYAQQYMGMYAPPQQPPPQNNNYNNYNNSYFGAPNANYGIQATGIFGPQAQPPSNASMNQQPVANYGNFLAINRQYQSQQNNAYSQQQTSSRSQQQQQQNPNQSQSQPPSGQSQQQSNSNSQNQSGPPQSHSQDTVSNSFFK